MIQIVFTSAGLILAIAATADLVEPNDVTAKWQTYRNLMFKAVPIQPVEGEEHLKQEAAETIGEMRSMWERLPLEIKQRDNDVLFWLTLSDFHPSDCTLAHDSTIDYHYEAQIGANAHYMCPYLLAYMEHVKSQKLEYCISVHKEAIVDSISTIDQRSREKLSQFAFEQKPSTNVLDKVVEYFAQYYTCTDYESPENMLAATQRIYEQQLADTCNQFEDKPELLKRALYLESNNVLHRVDPMVGEYIKLENFCYIVPRFLNYVATMATERCRSQVYLAHPKTDLSRVACC